MTAAEAGSLRGLTEAAVGCRAITPHYSHLGSREIAPTRGVQPRDPVCADELFLSWRMYSMKSQAFKIIFFQTILHFPDTICFPVLHLHFIFPGAYQKKKKKTLENRKIPDCQHEAGRAGNWQSTIWNSPFPLPAGWIYKRYIKPSWLLATNQLMSISVFFSKQGQKC